MDYAMLLSTLEEYVHMLINTCTDENIWWFILGVIVLFLLIVFLAIKKAKNNKNENLKRLPEHSIENCEYCLFYLMDYVLLQSRLPIREERKQNFGQRINPVNHIKDVEGRGLKNSEEWRKPVFQIGNIDEKIKDFFENKRIEIEEDDWDESCKIVDRVLEIVVYEMREAANKRFPGLVLSGTFKKQGSSREGLKVCDPLEFDVLLPFHLEDVQTKNDIVRDSSGRIMPGLFNMEIIDYDDMPSWWRKCELLDHNQNKTYLNTSNFQKKVFASLLDQTREEINKRLKKFMENTDDVYALVRSVISPSLKITIQVKSQNGLRDFKKAIWHSGDTFSRQKGFGSFNQVNLEIDLVPGILLSNDEYPKAMSNQKSFVYCERYGVMKWVNKHNPTILREDGNLIWRNLTCGYEKYMFDIAQRNSSQLYVMTACRLIKGALRELASDSNNQLGSVLKSYHLKNLCLYCFLFLTIHEKPNKLSSVTEAMGYFIEFIRLCLEAGNLPHFFHGNPFTRKMFPGYTFGPKSTKYNMFAMNSEETLIQARLGFKNFRLMLHGLYLKKKQLNDKKIKLFAGLLQRQ